jgi:hypothetical protein
MSKMQKNDKRNEDYLHANNQELSYNSDEDIENQRIIVPSASSIDYSTVEIKTKQVKKLEILPNRDKSLEFCRFMNSISIVILLATFYSITLLRINNRSYFILEQFKQESLYSEFNMYILYLAFFFVTCKY